MVGREAFLGHDGNMKLSSDMEHLWEALTYSKSSGKAYLLNLINTSLESYVSIFKRIAIENGLSEDEILKEIKTVEDVHNGFYHHKHE